MMERRKEEKRKREKQQKENPGKLDQTKTRKRRKPEK